MASRERSANRRTVLTNASPAAWIASYPAVWWLSASVILLLGFALRLWHVGEASLWTDELLTEIRAQAPFQQSLENMLRAGNQAPLYYFMLRTLPTQTEFLLRLPSVVMGVLGIALLMWVAFQMTRRLDITVWAGLLLAINPFHIMLSRTARAYTLLFVLALLAVYFFQLLLRGGRDQSTWAGFTVSSALAYLTHYSAAAMIPAQLIVLILIQRRRQQSLMRPWMIAQTAAITPLIIWALLLLTTFEQTHDSWFVPPQVTSAPMSVWNMLFGYDSVLRIGLLPAVIAASVGLGMSIRLALRPAHNVNHDTNRYWLIVIGLLLATALVVSWFITPAYKDRYFIVFLPGLILLFVQGALSLPIRWRRVILIVVAGTALINTALIFTNGDYERTDWRGATSLISESYQAGDTVLFERWNTSAVFERYYRGRQAVLAKRHLLVDLAEPDSLDASSGRIWAVFRNPIEDFHRQGQMPDFDPFAESISPMSDWLRNRESNILARHDFNGVSVFLVAGTTQP